MAIYAKGETYRTRNGEKTSEGKNPVGLAWGAEQWDEKKLRRELARHPDRGIGICFGPGRAPDGSWLIDLEGDGPRSRPIAGDRSGDRPGRSNPIMVECPGSS